MPTGPNDPDDRESDLPTADDMAFYEGLGRAIKVRRTAAGVSRKDLAEAAGLSYAYLSDLETGRGRPGSRVLRGLASALFLSPSTLLREAEGYRDQIVDRSEPLGNAGDVPPGRSDHRVAGDLDRQVGFRPLSASAEPLGFEDDREALIRAVADLSDEDIEIVMSLIRRLQRDE